MTNTVKKKIFLLVFCLSSVTQGMYSTYFVSILTTIERLYQIQSKTAGAIMSATEIGQILGALLIAYYGGKGNKPKWIAACMTLTAIAALISTSPHFLLNLSTTNSIKIIETQLPTTTTTQLPYLTSDLNIQQLNNSKSFEKLFNEPTQEQLCYLTNSDPIVLNLTYSPNPAPSSVHPHQATNNNPSSTHLQKPIGSILVIFFLCLLAIGFGSTAITTLGIPFIDDIVSKEESPLYLGLTIGLRIFGPALGFLLGSFCIRLDVDLLTTSTTNNIDSYDSTGVGAWWLGLIIISIPLLILALPMYYLSRLTIGNPDKDDSVSDFQDITYQAAEDHDIGGSRDFQTHVLTVGDLDVTSNRTCYSEIDSSSREVLQANSSTSQYQFNYGKNIILDRPIITRGSIFNKQKINGAWNAGCIVVNHFGGLESTSYANENHHDNDDDDDEAKSLQLSSTRHSSSSSSLPPPSSSLSTATATTTTTKQSTMNLSNSLSRLLKNRLLLLRLLSGILHILPIAGFYTFLPKYLMEQFRIAPSSASAISGLAGILFVGFGAFLGGTIIRVLNVNSRLMTKWIAISALLYALGMLILMNLGCPENHLVYHESSDFKLTDCLLNCKCSGNIYSPVCANGTTYMSPCLAGCKNYTVYEGKIIYDECGCSTNTANSSSNNNNHEEPHLNLNVATQGHCKHDCDNLKWYIIIFSIFTLIHASCEVGSMMFNLRCVKSGDRTLALGLITFTSSLLGTIPCSVIYGTVIDLTCVHWDTLTDPLMGELADNGTRGACRAYKNDNFRYYLHGFTAFVMFLAFLVDCLISHWARGVDFYDKNDSKHEGEEVTVALKKSTETI